MLIFRNQVLEKKKKFNRIHNQYLLKQNQLNELLQIHEMYKAEDIDFSSMNVRNYTEPLWL